MNETMREYLKRRQRWQVALFVIGISLIVLPLVLVAVMGRQDLRSEYREQLLIVRVCGLLVLVAGSLLRSRIKCPKCQKPLGAGGRWSSVPAFCPNCGVNFDEPMPQSQSPIG